MALVLNGSGITSANIVNGTIVDEDVADVAASKLTGALPAIDGSALTGVGKVLQVVYDYNDSGYLNTTSTAYVTWATAPTATITPSSTSSRIVILAYIGMQSDATGQCENTIYRTTGGVATDLSGGLTYGLAFNGVNYSGGIWQQVSINHIDSPNTTSPCTYAWYGRGENANAILLQYDGSPTNMILMEIA